MSPKDHVLREVVNSLRDIAIEFHGAAQLRERLRAALAPLLAARPVVAGEREQALYDADQVCRQIAWAVANDGDTEQEAAANKCRDAIRALATPQAESVGERAQPVTAPWSVVAEGQTVTLNYSFAAAVLGALFNGSSINAPAFEKIKQAFAAIMRGEKSASQDAIDAACYEVALTDEDIVTVLHSLAIDTFPSAYGFAETQVSGTNVPSIRRVVARCNRIIADKERIASSTKESA